MTRDNALRVVLGIQIGVAFALVVAAVVALFYGGR